MGADALPAYRMGYRPFAGRRSSVLREVGTLRDFPRFSGGREAPVASLQAACQERVEILPQAPPLLRPERHEADGAAHIRAFRR